MQRTVTKLAAWRKFRGLTQAMVVERLEEMGDLGIAKTAASLSRIETGKQPYNQDFLEALAEIYETDAASLIARDPHHSAQAQDLIARLPASDREQAEAMLAAMVKVAESRPGYRLPDPDDGGGRLVRRKSSRLAVAC